MRLCLIALLLVASCRHATLPVIARHAGPGGLPISVCVDKGLDFYLQVDVMDAMEAWNEALGSVYFAWRCPPRWRWPAALKPPRGGLSVPPGADGVWVMSAPIEAFRRPATALTEYWIPLRPPGARAIVWIAEGREPIPRYNLVLHELGHALGLGHGLGLMWPKVERYFRQRPDRQEIEAVRGLWGR